MSLRATLNQLIFQRRGGIFSLNEVHAYCKSAGFKQSNAERCLRPSLSPNVEAIKKNGYIIGYKWITNEKTDTQRVEEKSRPSPQGLDAKQQTLRMPNLLILE